MNPNEVADNILGFLNSHFAAEVDEVGIYVEIDDDDFRVIEDVELDDSIEGALSISLRLGKPKSANL